MNWNGGARSRFQPGNHGQFRRTYQLDNRRGENGIYGFTEHLENKRQCPLLDFVKAEFPRGVGAAMALQLSCQMELDKELIPADDDGPISGRSSRTDNGDEFELGRRTSMSEFGGRQHPSVLGNSTSSGPSTRASSIMSENQMNPVDRVEANSHHNSRFTFRARTSVFAGAQSQGEHFDRSYSSCRIGLQTYGTQRHVSLMFDDNARSIAAATTGWTSQRDPSDPGGNPLGTGGQNDVNGFGNMTSATTMERSNIGILEGQGFNAMQTNKNTDENDQEQDVSSSPEMWTTPPDIQLGPNEPSHGQEQMQ